MDRASIQNWYRNKATVLVYWSMCILVLLAAGIFLLRGDLAASGSTALIFLLMLVPSILKERYRMYLPFSLELAIVTFIFLTLFLGGVAQFYDRIPFWDKFLHFQSGLILGASGYVVVYLLNEHRKTELNLSPGFVSLFAVTFSLALGVVWEIFEFAGDTLSGDTFWQGVLLADTMWDLIADGVGALIVSIIGYFWMYRHKRLPFTPWFIRIFREPLRRKEQSEQM